MNHTLAFIGTVGAQEMMLIFFVILLLFGAKKLPELARGVGKSMGEFKKAREEFEHEITNAEQEATKPKPKPAPGNQTAKTVKESKEEKSEDA